MTKDIKEAVGNRKILTAQQVKKLPIGSVVWLHNTECEPGHWIEGHIGDGSGKYILGWDMAKS